MVGGAAYPLEMVANPQRRAELADAGLRVLAEHGARGLTHRAVDKAAGVPIGTCSNYFKSRAHLVDSLASRIFERLAPDAERLEELSAKKPSVELMIEYLQYIYERTTRAPELILALFELRLEASRSPELRATLGKTLTASYRDDISFNDGAGLPGGAFEIALLHYAIDGFLFDQLTTPIAPEVDKDTVIAQLAHRILGQSS